MRSRIETPLGLLFSRRRTICGSLLTGDGFPLELNFTTANREARWTADPWEPQAGVAPIDAARLALDRLELQSLFVPEFAELGLGQKFAWISGRHGVDDRYKLYVDLSCERALTKLKDRWSLPEPRINRTITPRMAAVNLADGTGEIYYRTEALVHELPRLLSVGDQPGSGNSMNNSSAKSICDLIEDASGRKLRDRMPGGSIGISYSNGHAPKNNSRGTGATVYLFARSLWGTDARIRDKWLALNGKQAEFGSPYEHASKGMAKRRSWATYHGMAGFHASPTGVGISLGVRPKVAA